MTFFKDKFKYEGSEIKGARLVKKNQNHSFLLKLFQEYGSLVKFVYHEKKYVVACKIVEQLLEPFSKSYPDFYNSGFHLFASNRIYKLFQASDYTAEAIMSECVKLTRGSKDIKTTILNSFVHSDWLLEGVLKLINHHPDVILNEVSRNGEFNPWLLELTSTSLIPLLGEWGKKGLPLDVTCDQSDVFKSSPQTNVVDFLGRNSDPILFYGRNIDYTLLRPINYEGVSGEVFGLQIADVFTSTFFFCLKKQNLVFSRKVFQLMENNTPHLLSNSCVTPNSDFGVENHEKYKTIFDSLGE